MEKVLLSSFLLSLISVNLTQDCICDTTSVCDLLCCCDPHCSADDKDSFTCQVETSDSLIKDKVCIPKNLFSKITLNWIEDSIVTEGDKYCFSSQGAVLPNSASTTKTVKVSAIDLQNTTLPLTYSKNFNYTAAFRKGLQALDPVYIHSPDSGLNRPLTLPAGLKNQCVQDSVLFLRNSTSSCSLTVKSEMCSSGSKIDVSAFEGLKLLSNFRNYSSEDNTTSDLIFDIVDIESTCLDETDTLVTCSVPTVDSSNCQNVLQKIDLRITHSNSIVSAELKMHLRTVPIDSSSTLETSVSFESESNEYLISGPRYERFKHNYGVYFHIGDVKSFFTPFSNDSDCSSVSGKVKFPISTISSCSKVFDLDSTDFTSLVNGVYGGLPKSLAKFFNSDLTKSDEWLSLEWNIPEVLNSTNVPTLLELTIYHRSFGSRVYPENEIVSVTTSVSTTNIEKMRSLFSDKVVFYFSIRFFSVDPAFGPQENIFDRLARTFPNYSFPFQMVFVAVFIIVVFSIGILVWEHGKPEF